MTKFKSLFLATVMGIAVFVAATHAADTSSTVVVRDTNMPIGIVPTTGQLEATSTATGSFTVDAPVPGSKRVKTMVCETRDSNGNQVPRNVTISATTQVITVTNATGQTSGTLAVGDKLKCVFTY